MITEKQLKIFAVLKPYTQYTMKQIKELAKEKSNNAMTIAIKQFRKEGLLTEKKVGRSSLFALDLNSDLVYNYIGLANNGKIQNQVKVCLDILSKEILEQTPFFAMAVFGSYAAGKQKKDSDIDIAVFIEEQDKRKHVESLINSAKQKAPLELDVQVISRAEMIEMLTNKEENLGKQIARKHLAVYNHRIFYEIIKEGIERGFRP